MNAMNRESRSPGAYEPIEYWLRGNLEQNFGDFLTPLFVERLFQPIAISDRSDRLIGSVVADFIIRDTPGATPVHPLVFWGCGLRDEASLTPAWRASAEILAVRGPLSQAALGGRVLEHAGRDDGGKPPAVGQAVERRVQMRLQFLERGIGDNGVEAARARQDVA